MKLQLDTSVQIHRLLNRGDDAVNAGVSRLVKESESVEISTYAKKEFAFSVIKDCCTMLARINRRRSLRDALNFVDTYGSRKKRFRGRMLAVWWRFCIARTVKSQWASYGVDEKDTLLGEEFARFLRLYIPVLWEEFERGVSLPLQDRTKCVFARKPPADNGQTFDFHTKRKCVSSCGCALHNMIRGERKRGLRLLERLRELDQGEETEELRRIRDVLEGFLEKGNKEVCYEMCNQGIGDMIIALETLADRTLVTTNAKESHIISPAISQKYVVVGMQDQGLRRRR